MPRSMNRKNVELPLEVHQRLQAAAIRQHRTTATLAALAVEEWLKREGPPMNATDIIATWLSETHLMDPDAPRADIRTTAERINDSETGWTFTTPSAEPGHTVRHERFFFSDAELETVIVSAEQKSGYR